jgi:hypothetical protein
MEGRCRAPGLAAIRETGLMWAKARLKGGPTILNNRIMKSTPL